MMYMIYNWNQFNGHCNAYHSKHLTFIYPLSGNTFQWARNGNIVCTLYCQNNHLLQYIATVYNSMQYEELKREKGCRGPDLRALCLLVFDGQTASIFYDSILQYRALRKYLQGQAMNKK